MAALSVQTVTPEMFPKVHPLLDGFSAHQMRRADWRQMLFEHPWRSDGDPFGYSLVDGDEPVGFIGTIYSRQAIGRRKARFCNLSSWIVKPAYRMHALRMLRPVLEDQDTTFTCLTLIGATARIFQRFGFEVLEDAALILSPLSGVFSAASAVTLSWTRDPNQIAPALRDHDLDVFERHRTARCGHLLIRWRGAQLYLLTTRWVLRGQGVSHVHYVSDLSLFWDRLGGVQWALLRAQGTLFTMIDKRQAGGRAAPFDVTYALPRPRLFRPSRSCQITPTDVSALCSELMYLRV